MGFRHAIFAPRMSHSPAPNPTPQQALVDSPMLGMVRLWIWLNTVLVAGGWGLSAALALDPVGYALLGVLFVVGAWLFCLPRGCGPAWRLVPLCRFRRPLPCLFLLLLVMALVGGALWRPEFADGLAYRTPRVLHWLHQHGWEWIHTMDARKNNRGVGFEWVTAPLLLFTHSDRSLFLINIASLALLPGLIFAFLRAEWVARTLAWSWSWVLAGAMGFVTQAGSIAADLHAVPFYLAAIVFARRAATGGGWRDLSFSALGIALASCVKPFNLVLFLPWFIVVYPALRIVLRRRAWHLAWLVPIATACSFVPLAVINIQHTGNWTGLTPKPETGRIEFTPVSPAIGFAGNAWLIVSQNILPPFVPHPPSMLALESRLAATPTGQRFNESFENLFFMLRAQEGEATAGLGLAVVLLLLATAITAPRGAAFGLREDGAERSPVSAFRPPLSVRLADLSIWLGLLAFMLHAGAYEAGRLVMPFYLPLLAPLLRRPGWPAVVRRRWWKRAATLSMLYTASILLLSRGRPLLPWEKVLTFMHRVQPASATWPRALAAYQTHERRADLLAPVRAALPPEEKTIGLVARVSKEATLWLPYGSRFVVGLAPEDTIEDLRRRGIRYVVVQEDQPGKLLAPADEWLKEKADAVTVTNTIEIESTLSQKGETWRIMRLGP
jgi:hypothetical protein